MPVFIRIFKMILYLHFFGMHCTFFLNIPTHHTEKARKKALKEAVKRSTDLCLRQFLACSVQTRKGRISDHNFCLLAQQGTNCTHTSPPQCYLESPLLQKFYSDIYLFGFILSQRYKLSFCSISAATEIKAGKCDIWRKELKLRKSFISARTVAMKIKHDVFNAAWCEE